MSMQGFLYLRLPYTVVLTNGLFFFHYSPVASRLLPCGHPACKTKYSSLWKARIKQVEEERSERQGGSLSQNKDLWIKDH